MRSRTQLAAAVGVLSLLAAGCGDACEDLQDVCDRCEDPNHKASCEMSVDRDDGDRCDRDLSSYCLVCGRSGAAVVEVCR